MAAQNPTDLEQAVFPASSATAIYIFGNQPNEILRVSFLNYLLSFVELEDYPRRAAFIAAYSAGGSEKARRIEAKELADSFLLSAHDIAHCVERAMEQFFTDGAIAAQL